MSTRSSRREAYLANMRQYRVKWLLEEVTGLFRFIEQFPCEGKEPHQIVDQYLSYLDTLDTLDKLEAEGCRRHVNGGSEAGELVASRQTSPRPLCGPSPRHL